ncbi:MAG: TRAP transporter small permease [candidate division WOR-3 bacterium]
MEKIIKVLVDKLLIVTVVPVIGMTAIMALDVIARYTLRRAFLDTLEISSMLLGMTISLALASVTYKGEHVQFTMLIERLSPKAQGSAAILTLLITLVVFGALTWQATIRAFSSMREGEFVGSMELPIWPVKLVFAFCCLITMMALATNLVSSVRHERGE